MAEEEEEQEEDSAEGWARRLELDQLVTRRVLDVLALGGIVDRRDGRYTAAPAARSFDTSPGGVAGQARVWGSVVDALRSGERHADYGPVADRDRTYAGVVDDLARLNEPGARQLAGRLGPADRVLDVGAWAAVWNLAMARHHPGALHLSLRTASGAPHPRPEVEAWCVQAGLEVRDAFRLQDGPLEETVLVARAREGDGRA